MSAPGRGRSVVVVGAGITGLTAAHALATAGASVTVVDAAERVGGLIRTTPFAGRPVDWGADAFLARVPEGVELCRELGLAGRLTSPMARRAFVYTHGRLSPLPDGLVLGVPTDLDALAASGVVSPAGVARAAEDLHRPAPPLQGDVAVGSYVRDRLGDEVFEVLVAPLLSGVNAGDADELSLEAGAPQLAAAAHRGGSLIEALRSQAAATDPAAPVFYGLPTGTQTLTDALAASATAAGAQLQLGTPVTGLDRTAGGGWRVRIPDGTLRAEAVVLATPAYVTAPLLETLAPAVAAELAELAYASVALVTLAVPRDRVDHPLDGSGFLVAEREGLLLTACSWASSKWAHLADERLVLLRASAGRAHDPRFLDLDDHDLVATLVEELGATMGLHGPPTEVRVSRWLRALPQYRPGHLERVTAWRTALAADAPGLVVAGAAYDGLGLPTCIRQARQAAVTVLAA